MTIPDGVQARAETASIALPKFNVSVYQLMLVTVLVAALNYPFDRNHGLYNRLFDWE